MSAFFKRPYVVNARLGAKITLSNGVQVQFQPVSADLGVWPPEGRECNAAGAALIREAIAARTGGITEITQAEYDALIAKKKANPNGIKGRWREEMGLNQTVDQAAAARMLPPMARLPAGGASGAAAAVEARPAAAAEQSAGLPRPVATKA